MVQGPVRQDHGVGSYSGSQVDVKKPGGFALGLSYPGREVLEFHDANNLGLGDGTPAQPWIPRPNPSTVVVFIALTVTGLPSRQWI